jgi:hypothetical protein
MESIAACRKGKEQKEQTEEGKGRAKGGQGQVTGQSHACTHRMRAKSKR